MAEVLPVPKIGESVFTKACSEAISSLKADQDALMITFRQAPPSKDGSRMIEVYVSNKIGKKNVLVMKGLMREDLMLNRIFPVYGEPGREGEISGYMRKGLWLKIEVKRPAALALQKLDLYPIPAKDEISSVKARVRWDEMKENLLKGIPEDMVSISFARRVDMAKPPAKEQKRTSLLKMR